MPHPHWIKRFLTEEWLGLIFAVVLAVVVQVAEFGGWFASFEGRVQDLLLSARTTSNEGTSSKKKVVTVEIDDYAYKTCFGSRSPLDPNGVTGLVASVAQVGPAVIGVDILTNPEIEESAATYRSWWDKPRTRFNVPIVWVADLTEPLSEPRSVWKWLWGNPELPEAVPGGVLGFNMSQLEKRKEIFWGLPLYPLEDDLGVRSLPRRFVNRSQNSSEPMPGFAYQVAKKYCDSHSRECNMDRSKHNEVFISYAGTAPAAYTLRQVFRCTHDKEPPTLNDLSTEDLKRMQSLQIKTPGLLFNKFMDQAKGAIVLIGGTFGAARDTYFTPAGRIPGLSLNAYAVESELAGRSVKDTWRVGIFLVDILLGWLIVFFFWYPAIKLPMSRKVLHRLRRILVVLTWLLIELLVWWPSMKSRMEIRRNKLETFALVRHNEIRWMIAASLSLVIFTFFASLIVFRLGYLWLTWIGVLIGMGPHVISEIWKMNPRVLEEDEESSHGRARPA
jgi:CHASE2 domain-containing sensor protein